MSEGKLITIEGIDGCGKDTQSKELVSNIHISGLGCVKFDFPRYHTPSGKIIGEHQKNGTLKDLKIEEIANLYAKDRLAAQEEISSWLSYYDTVVINNRYLESNLAYQGARDFEKRREVWDYILDLELNKYKIRPSDIVVLLDLPAEQCAQAMKKQGRILDVNEEKLSYQRIVRRCYLELADLYKETWFVINCMEQDMQTRKEIPKISQEIFEAIKKRLPKKESYIFS